MTEDPVTAFKVSTLGTPNQMNQWYMHGTMGVLT